MTEVSRKEKSLRNLRYGVIYQAIDVVLKFAMRTALVYTLGDAVVGLNGLFTEILSMLSLAEMGVGSAIIYSLYKPLAEHDTISVQRLMRLFQRAYRVIALGIAAVGLILMPFIHLLVRDVDFDIGYLRLVYLIYLASTASSYLFSYKSALLNADQQAYHATRIHMIMDVVVTVLKTASLLLFKNFVLFLVINVVGRLASNLLINNATNRLYPYLRERVDLPPKDEQKAIFKNIRYLFIGKLSGVVTNSTDNTLISVMDSTLSVGFYSNYSMILNNAKAFIAQIMAASAGGIGNLMVKEPERCYATLKRLTFLLFMVGTTVTTCFASQISPLISLWLGPTRVMSGGVVAVLLINFFLFAIREPLWQFMSVSGLFRENKNTSILGSAVNLVLSVALGIPFGMLGIFIGTTATLVIQYILKVILLCRKKFGISTADFFLFTARCSATALLSALAARRVCAYITLGNPWLSLIVGVAVSAVIAVGAALLVFLRSPELKYFMGLLGRVLEKIKKKLSRKKLPPMAD